MPIHDVPEDNRSSRYNIRATAVTTVEKGITRISA